MASQIPTIADTGQCTNPKNHTGCRYVTLNLGYFAPSVGYTKNIQDHPLFGHNNFRKLHWTNYPPFIENLSDNQKEGVFLKQDGVTAHTATYSTVILLDIFESPNS